MNRQPLMIIMVIAVLLLIGVSSGEARYRHGGIWIGGPIWGVPYPYPYPYPYTYRYPYPDYYYPAPPPVIIEKQPETYIQKAPSEPPEQGYWYYCPSPQGYYPAIKECPDGWMKVVPTEPDDMQNQPQQPALPSQK